MERNLGHVIAERYRLVRKLGAGGMGSVWLAYDLSLDSTCALKLIEDDKARSEEVRMRFEREAKAAAQIRGAHVVDVFAHGESNGTLYIAMEYLEGEDLGKRLDRVGKLDMASTYRVIAHVCRALVRAHAGGIVHRDLKPENIFLVPGDEEEIAKVLDFGIAKHDAYTLQDKATRTGSFLGTPFYVSPEQARGKSTDYRSDLWSLGIIAFQCLTGRPPFQSDALGELMGLILYEDMPRLTAFAPHLPRALDAWWERAACRDREGRFQSAKELSDALGHACGIERLISVPAIAPRRSSYSDATGDFPALRASLLPGDSGVSAVSAHSAVSARAAMPALPSFSDPNWKEEPEGTDAPVSHTRQSDNPPDASHGPLRKLASFAGSGRAFARRLPKRSLALAAVGIGIAVGVSATAMLMRNDPSNSNSVPLRGAAGTVVSAVPALATAPAAQPAASANLVPSASAAPTVSLAVDALPSANNKTSSAAAPNPAKSAAAPRSTPLSDQDSALNSEKRSKTPPAKRRPVRGPDYGI